MNFEIVKGSIREDIEEVYYLKSMSFDCSPLVNVDIDLALSYVNLGIDSDDMCVKCLWGFSPKDGWKDCDLILPSAIEGKLKLVGEYEAGRTWRVDDKIWESYFDKKSGWYCIGNPNSKNDDIAVRINKNMLVVINNREIKAAWVQPIFEKEE